MFLYFYSIMDAGRLRFWSLGVLECMLLISLTSAGPIASLHLIYYNVLEIRSKSMKVKQN